MEPAQGWPGWYQERMAPLYRLYQDREGWDYWDQEQSDLLGDGFDFEFDEGEY